MKLVNAQNRPWLRRLLWALLAFVVLLVVGWLAVPPILKSQAQRIGSEQLGRALSIGSVDFKPWSLELALGDIAIAGAVAGAPPQVEIKRLYIDASLQSLVRLAPVVRAVAVDEPKIRVTRLADGGYDFDDVLARLTAPSDKPSGKPLQFAVYNVEVKGGSLDFDDQPVGKAHTVRDLQLGLPFLSNFDSRLEVKVLPHLSLLFNGSKFETTAESTPFADSRKTDAKLQLSNFDLAPYLGYLPKDLPLKLQAGVVQAKLQLHFEQLPAASLKLTGELEAQNFKVNDIQGRQALAFDGVKVVLDEVRPLEKLVKLASIEVTAPELELVRDAKGEINLLEGSSSPDAAHSGQSAKKAQKTPEKGAASAASKAASAAKDANPQLSPAPGEATAEWRVALAKASVKDGQMRWEDHSASLRGGVVKHLAHDVALDVSAVTWPVANPVAFSGTASVEAVGERPSQGQTAAPAARRLAGVPAPVAKGPITFEGTATDKMAKVNVKLSALPLALGARYVDVFVVPAVSGQLSADLDVAWDAPSRLQIHARQMQLDQLSLVDTSAASGKGTRTAGKKGALANELASVQTLLITNASIGVDTHKVSIERVAVNTPRARVERAADQTWMFEHWMRATQGSFKDNAPMAAAVVEAVTEVAESGAARWAVNVDSLLVEGGAVAFVDNGASQPVQVDLSEIKADAKSFVLGGKKPSPVTLSLKVRAGNTEPGRLLFQGAAGTEPLSVKGQVDMAHLPLQVADPYVAHLMNVRFVRADTSFKGQVDVSMARDGLAAKVGGNLTVEDFRANGTTQVTTPAAPSAAAAESPQLAAAVASSNARRGRELLSWKVLNLRGVDVALSPGKAPVAVVKETALDDFYARIILNENGRLNLQDLVKSSEADAAATSAAPATAAAKPATAAASTPVVAKAPHPLDPVINFGPITLVNGRVAFSDFFIKPNYSADLSELAGKLSAFSSVPVQGMPQLADLELRGKAEGTASLDIQGKLNPLAKPLALDINAKVKDLELPPLSPYSIKYVGHGIERGKLSVDVHYNIKPDGLLTAENSIVLNQLTFGEAVPGAPTSLPVKLATALLSDSNGVIDLNLPISGSLNDPQFSIVPIIFKILGNIIVKAVAAPFSALGKAFSGGSGSDELSTVVFTAGSDDLTPAAEENLNKVVKALESKPALKLTVVGEASEAVELESYKRERLLRRMRAEKRRAGMADANASGSGAAASTPGGRADASDIQISDAEYPELVKALYKRADFPKPRNAIGLAKDLPVPEMEALLLANMRIPDQAMHELATQRGVAVRDYLAAQKLSTDRLFLGAPKLVKADEKWTPRANLSLAAP
ncbi:DUF748 domain-containing protein [Variovorax sp. HJSM1_2]|uniref:DUF748 domain-containing protein n=1 Tax=Variovorax sp. HJSM1_2 TaxID=3366263 RepID=UPI003BC2C17A